MLARDVMEKNVVTVKEDSNVEDATRLLIEKGISGAPVVDEEGYLKGIISEGDLIYREKQIHIPAVIQILDSTIFVESVKKFQEELKKITAYKVKELMTKDVVTVEMNAPIEEIATLMIEKKINRIPVVEEGKVIGIITRQNVLKSMIGK